MMTKSKLRKIYLARQTALSETERKRKSRQIKENFFARFSLEKVRRLHLFLSIREKGEIDTSPILKTIRKDFPHVRTFVPRVNFKADRLEHLEFNSGTKLRTSHWGIAEPVGDELIDEKTFDLILVPLLAFDERGYRVGHGKGFYDKFLSLCRPDVLKVGLSFFEPVKEIADINKFDVPLDFCVTPEKTFELITDR